MMAFGVFTAGQDFLCQVARAGQIALRFEIAIAP